jgi:hypothetical protein
MERVTLASLLCRTCSMSFKVPLPHPLPSSLNLLSGKALSAPDKRQLPAISQSLTALVQQHTANQILADTFAKLDQLVAALNSKNINSATALHTVCALFPSPLPFPLAT